MLPADVTALSPQLMTATKDEAVKVGSASVKLATGPENGTPADGAIARPETTGAGSATLIFAVAEPVVPPRVVTLTVTGSVAAVA